MLPNADMTGLSAVNEFAQFQKHRHLKAVLPLMARRQQNSVIKINYQGSGNNSQFAFDGLGNTVKVFETSAGVVGTTKQFVLVGNQKREARDASGTLTSRYFKQGETLSTSNYFYSSDHIGSIRDVTNVAGAVQNQSGYEPFGKLINSSGSLIATFQYAGYYYHAASGLSLAAYREYYPAIAKWSSRDPWTEKAGLNLFAYVLNEPISRNDPLGLLPGMPYGYWGGPGWTNGQPGPAAGGDFPHAGESGFMQPKDPRDNCYYQHDVCIQKAAFFPDPKVRKCLRHHCDVSLGSCIGNCPGWWPTKWLEQFGFPTLSPNNNPGPYDQYNMHNFNNVEE